MAHQQSIAAFFRAAHKRPSSEAGRLDAGGEQHNDREDCQPPNRRPRLCSVLTEESNSHPTSNLDTQVQDTVRENATTCTDFVGRPFDVGLTIKIGMSVKEVSTAVSALSGGEKYKLLFRHTSPPTVLPSTRSYGGNRKFNTDWLTKYSWLVYSPANDAVYCAPCALLCSEKTRADKGLFVNVPFRNWVKLSESLAAHAKHTYHAHCMDEADTFRAVVDNPDSRLDVMVRTVLQDRLTTNKHILQQIVRAILYLTKQGLALRGHREGISSSSNPGNFLALLKNQAANDAVLKKHLEQPLARNGTYLSPRSQNDIMGIIGFDIIRAKIVEEVKEAKFYAVLADEISSHNVEHLAVCLRFVDASGEIREEFVSFVKMVRVRAVDIEQAITGLLTNLGLSLEDLRGQGYDGASTMSGEKSGVQRRILDKQPKAVYTHCSGHSLNLVIAQACAEPCVRNCISVIKAITLWIRASPKREGLLKQVCERQQQAGAAHGSPLLNVCITRWVENIDGWQRFMQCHPYLVELCEVIIYGSRHYAMFSDGFSADDKKDAVAHLKSLESFSFIYAMVVLHRTLSYVREPIKRLQGVSQDLYSGLMMIEDCQKELLSIRFNADELTAFSDRIYNHSCCLAAKSDIAPVVPRTCQRQQHRSNYQCSDPKQYFKVTVLLPFLDHLLADLKARFAKHVQKVARLQSLLPSSISETSSFQDIEEAVIFYSADLPNPDIVDEEFVRWKRKWLNIPPQSRSQSLKDCLAPGVCTMPNLRVLMQLFATLPLSTCSCERSGSALRRLNTYLRSTQSEDRLAAAALIHVNYATPVDINHVCKLFMQKHPRRIEAPSMLFDNS